MFWLLASEFAQFLRGSKDFFGLEKGNAWKLRLMFTIASMMISDTPFAINERDDEQGMALTTYVEGTLYLNLFWKSAINALKWRRPVLAYRLRKQYKRLLNAAASSLNKNVFWEFVAQLSGASSSLNESRSMIIGNTLAEKISGGLLEKGLKNERGEFLSIITTIRDFVEFDFLKREFYFTREVAFERLLKLARLGGHPLRRYSVIKGFIWVELFRRFFDKEAFTISEECRWTNLVYFGLIHNNSFGDVIAKEFGLKLPQSHHDPAIIAFTKELRVKVLFSQLMSDEICEIFGLQVFKGHEREIIQATECCGLYSDNLIYFLGLLNNEELAGLSYSHNYDARRVKSAPEFRAIIRNILGINRFMSGQACLSRLPKERLESAIGEHPLVATWGKEGRLEFNFPSEISYREGLKTKKFVGLKTILRNDQHDLVIDAFSELKERIIEHITMAEEKGFEGIVFYDVLILGYDLRDIARVILEAAEEVIKKTSPVKLKEVTIAFPYEPQEFSGYLENRFILQAKEDVVTSEKLQRGDIVYIRSHFSLYQRAVVFSALSEEKQDITFLPVHYWANSFIGFLQSKDYLEKKYKTALCVYSLEALSRAGLWVEKEKVQEEEWAVKIGNKFMIEHEGNWHYATIIGIVHRHFIIVFDAPIGKDLAGYALYVGVFGGEKAVKEGAWKPIQEWDTNPGSRSASSLTPINPRIIHTKEGKDLSVVKFMDLEPDLQKRMLYAFEALYRLRNAAEIGESLFVPAKNKVIAWLMVAEEEKGRVVHVDVCVLENHRNNGIGEALYKYWLACCVPERAERIISKRFCRAGLDFWIKMSGRDNIKSDHKPEDDDLYWIVDMPAPKSSASPLEIMEEFSNLLRMKYGIHIFPFEGAEGNRILSLAAEMINKEENLDYFKKLESSQSELGWFLDDLYELNGPDMEKDSMSITEFFRENLNWRRIRSILLRLINANSSSKTINILSAGVSTGEEAYSLLFMLGSLLKKKGEDVNDWNINIWGVGNDLRLLLEAGEGSYKEQEIERGLNNLRKQGISMDISEYMNNFRIKPEYKNLVRFLLFDYRDKQFLGRLAEHIGQIDFGISSFVLFYLNESVLHNAVFEQLVKLLRPGGSFYFVTTDDPYVYQNKLPAWFSREGIRAKRNREAHNAEIGSNRIYSKRGVYNSTSTSSLAHNARIQYAFAEWEQFINDKNWDEARRLGFEHFPTLKSSADKELKRQLWLRLFREVLSSNEEDSLPRCQGLTADIKEDLISLGFDMGAHVPICFDLFEACVAVNEWLRAFDVWTDMLFLELSEEGLKRREQSLARIIENMPNFDEYQQELILTGIYKLRRLLTNGENILVEGFIQNEPGNQRSSSALVFKLHSFLRCLKTIISGKDKDSPADSHKFDIKHPRDEGARIIKAEVNFINVKEARLFGNGDSIYPHEKELLSSIIGKLVLNETDPEHVTFRLKIYVRWLADTGVSRVFGVTWSGRHYVIKRSADVFYNKYIDNQWMALNILHEKHEIPHIALPAINGVATLRMDDRPDQRIAYLVTNYFQGTSLQERIFRGGPMDVEEAIPLFVKLCELVGFIHSKGIIIRELKPGNIMLLPGNDIALYDFNVSMASDYDWDSDSLELKDTVRHDFADDGWEYYTRPRARIKPDIQSDIFTIGMDLFLALTGKTYYQGPYVENIGFERVHNKAAKDIIAKAIGPRQARYRNVTELIADLINAQQGTIETTVASSLAPTNEYFKSLGNFEQDIEKAALLLNDSRMNQTPLWIEIGCGLARTSFELAKYFGYNFITTDIFAFSGKEGAYMEYNLKWADRDLDAQKGSSDNSIVVLRTGPEIIKYLPPNSIDILFTIYPPEYLLNLLFRLLGNDLAKERFKKDSEVLIKPIASVEFYEFLPTAQLSSPKIIIPLDIVNATSEHFSNCDFVFFAPAASSLGQKAGNKNKTAFPKELILMTSETYPLYVPQEAHAQAIQKYGEKWLSSQIKETVSLNITPEEFAGEREEIQKIIKNIFSKRHYEELLGRLELIVFIVTNKESLLDDRENRIRVASVNAFSTKDELGFNNTIYLHPYFFSLPEIVREDILGQTLSALERPSWPAWYASARYFYDNPLSLNKFMKTVSKSKLLLDCTYTRVLGSIQLDNAMNNKLKPRKQAVLLAALFIVILFQTDILVVLWNAIKLSVYLVPSILIYKSLVALIFSPWEKTSKEERMIKSALASLAMRKRRPSNMFWAFMNMVVYAPTFEEILNRWILLNVAFLLLIYVGFGYISVTAAGWASVILSGVFFGLLHYKGYYVWSKVFGTSISGIIFGYYYWQTRSLITTLVIHGLINSVGFLFMLALFIAYRSKAAKAAILKNDSQGNVGKKNGDGSDFKRSASPMANGKLLRLPRFYIRRNIPAPPEAVSAEIVIMRDANLKLLKDWNGFGHWFPRIKGTSKDLNKITLGLVTKIKKLSFNGYKRYEQEHDFVFGRRQLQALIGLSRVRFRMPEDYFLINDLYSALWNMKKDSWNKAFSGAVANLVYYVIKDSLSDEEYPYKPLLIDIESCLGRKVPYLQSLGLGLSDYGGPWEDYDEIMSIVGSYEDRSREGLLEWCKAFEAAQRKLPGNAASPLMSFARRQAYPKNKCSSALERSGLGGISFEAQELVRRLINTQKRDELVEISNALGLDIRPVKNGLFHPLFVGFDMAMKEVINPFDKDVVAVNSGAGATVSRFLLGTNAPRSCFVDTSKIEFKALKDALKKWDSILQGILIKNYLTGNWKHGAGWSYRNKMLLIEYKIIADLKCMGVDKFNSWGAKNIRLDKQGARHINITFDWAYKDKEAKSYSIDYITADITDNATYTSVLNDALNRGIDIYYQKAGFHIARYYHKFLYKLASSVKEGGYLATEDKTHYIEIDNPDSILQGWGLRYTKSKEEWSTKMKLFAAYLRELRQEHARGPGIITDHKIESFRFKDYPYGSVVDLRKRSASPLARIAPNIYRISGYRCLGGRTKSVFSWLTDKVCCLDQYFSLNNVPEFYDPRLLMVVENTKIEKRIYLAHYHQQLIYALDMEESLKQSEQGDVADLNNLALINLDLKDGNTEHRDCEFIVEIELPNYFVANGYEDKLRGLDNRIYRVTEGNFIPWLVLRDKIHRLLRPLVLNKNEKLIPYHRNLGIHKGYDLGSGVKYAIPGESLEGSFVTEIRDWVPKCFIEEVFDLKEIENRLLFLKPEQVILSWDIDSLGPVDSKEYSNIARQLFAADAFCNFMTFSFYHWSETMKTNFPEVMKAVYLAIELATSRCASPLAQLRSAIERVLDTVRYSSPAIKNIISRIRLIENYPAKLSREGRVAIGEIIGYLKTSDINDSKLAYYTGQLMNPPFSWFESYFTRVIPRNLQELAEQAKIQGCSYPTYRAVITHGCSTQCDYCLRAAGKLRNFMPFPWVKEIYEVGKKFKLEIGLGWFDNDPLRDYFDPINGNNYGGDAEIKII
ncbi:MAG: CheR family methyltransferase, partial [Candidatus Omnitrophota bacterium]